MPTDYKAALQGGPMIIALEGDGAFMNYGTGIFNRYCSIDNHEITLVGWGVESGVEYWIARNSWGTTWGEAGHIRIRINGNCRIYFEGYPVV